LRADGSVIGWGSNSDDRSTPPASAINVVAIAAGSGHSLALREDGTVVGWGYNGSGQTIVPANLTEVSAIAGGSTHSLALRTNGAVTGWGGNFFRQATPPDDATNAVAIAAGASHSLALRADGRVIGWGYNRYGQATGTPTTTSPYSSADFVVLEGQILSDVVAIAAGSHHSLALRADRTVVGWGYDYDGETITPASATNVVAIAAGDYHSLALRADGAVVGWGRNYEGQTTIPAWATNVIAIAAGGNHSLFLKAIPADWPVGDGDSFAVLAHIPARVGQLIRGVEGLVLTNLDFNLHDAAIELSGSKALIQAVLELGMPYTLERDDVLHGFLYGSESLVDLEASRTFMNAEIAKLDARFDAPPQALTEVAVLRYLRFTERLAARLDDLGSTGEPEFPRLVGHTLGLLNLLRDAWATVPPPALEICVENNALNLILYGEPYSRYALQYSDDLTAPGWTGTTNTNLRNEESTSLPLSGSAQRFYQAVLPQP
jgi:hypothetical protein